MKYSKAGMMIGLSAISIFLITGCGESTENAAAEYPSEDLTITVPYAAGGLNDLVSRQVADLSEAHLDASAAVTNVTGGGGTTAATEYIQEQENSTNMILGSKSIFVTIPQEQDVEYTYEDVEPIIGIDTVEFILYTNPDETGIESVDDLIAYGKENTINYGTEGPGSDPDLIQAGLFSMDDVDAEPVVYGGGGESVQNVASGEIDVAAGPPAVGKQYVEEGELEAIAVAMDEPFERFEGEPVPTLEEEGYDITFPGFNFFALPGGTEQDVIDKMNSAISDMYETEEFQEFIEDTELNLDPMGPDEIDKIIEEQQSVAEELQSLIEENQ
ncbi:Bug family tripartite tricarboxylate transporter substrate binding protein [Salibacterium aidingense]|uniref:Bug family tripartite tricarboxylate transporter substrate binding protein n=1 Tax=Salibacterium aidingense TaxID=384933 RepID=UPI003BBF5CDD